MGRKDLKISIRNLGPMKEAEIELKPLTIFIGPNNTGKTWAAYSVAAAFEMIEKEISEFSMEFLNNLRKREDHFEINVEDILKKMDFEKYIYSSFSLYFSKFMYINKKLINGVDYKIDKLNIKINESFFRKKQSVLFEIDELSIGGRAEKAYPTIEKPENSFTYELNGFRNKKEAVQWLELAMIFEIRRSLYEDIIVFPSERTSLSYMSDLLAYEALKNIDEEGELRSQKPIRDHARLIGRLKNFYNIRKNRKLINLVENEILSGKIKIEKENLKNEIKYYFKDMDSNKNISLKIHATSSLVKALSIFYLYIRNYGYENKLFIIDEPAMNLHPEAQVKFLELITMLVNDGANFIITTHTPYIVDHLINLMEAYRSEKKDEIQELFFLKDKKAFISPNKVAVYEFTKEGKVKDILDRKEITINWETFSKISEKIANIYFKI